MRPGQRLRQNMPDPSIGKRIAKQLGLTAEELAATSLGLATGKGDTFSVPSAGGLPSTVAEITRRRTASGLRDLDTSVAADPLDPGQAEGRRGPGRDRRREKRGRVVRRHARQSKTGNF